MPDTGPLSSALLWTVGEIAAAGLMIGINLCGLIGNKLAFLGYREKEGKAPSGSRQAFLIARIFLFVTGALVLNSGHHHLTYLINMGSEGQSSFVTGDEIWTTLLLLWFSVMLFPVERKSGNMGQDSLALTGKMSVPANQ